MATVPSYPTSPAPLSAGDVRDFTERRAGASRQLKEALTRREAGRQEALTDFEGFKRRLMRAGRRQESDMRTQFGARRQAFQPRFMGQGLRDLRDSQARTFAEGRERLAERMAALEEAVRSARLGRDEEMAAIERDRARRWSRLDSLIRPLGF